MSNGNDLYNNWTLEGYNNAYGNTGNTDRFPNEGNLYKQFDQDMNFRGPDPFGSFRSGIGSFYNQRPVYQGQRNIHEGFGAADVSSTFASPEKKGLFSKFTTPVLSVLRGLKGHIQDNPEEAFARGAFPLDNGRVNYHPNDSLYAGMNVSSGFGQGLSAAGQKRIDRIRNTIAGIEGGNWSQLQKNDPDAYEKKLAFHRDKLKRFEAEQAAYQADLAAQTGQGGTEIIPPDTGGKDVKSYQPVGHYGAAQGTKGSWTPGGTYSGGGYQQKDGSHHKDGGRIGYANGEFVDEDINIEGPGFDVNENMEMAEISPFEARIQELIDEGMSWQEAYQIASEEFATAEGPEDSFSDQGLASLV